MRRYRQTVEELVEALGGIEASWKDEHSDSVIRLIEAIPEKGAYAASDIAAMLDRDFQAAMTAIRLVLEMSKDEFEMALKAGLGSGGVGIKRYAKDGKAFISALLDMKILESLKTTVGKPVSWRDLLVERLKMGRGSAIKAQTRGRYLEQFSEDIVKRVFSRAAYDVRCRFTGAGGTSTEKADFAIPSKEEPRILIEAKAYGATGSKQTDILGDIARIVGQKRSDTHLLLVTDGITWKMRLNDLRKLVEMQNTGLIARIYTRRMARELESDLNQLRLDHSLRGGKGDSTT